MIAATAPRPRTLIQTRPAELRLLTPRRRQVWAPRTRCGSKRARCGSKRACSLWSPSQGCAANDGGRVEVGSSAIRWPPERSRAELVAGDSGKLAPAF